MSGAMLNESSDRALSVQLINIAGVYLEKRESDLMKSKMSCLEYEKTFSEIELLRRLKSDMEKTYRVHFDDDNSSSTPHSGRESR